VGGGGGGGGVLVVHVVGTQGHCVDTIAACRDRARLRSSGGTAPSVSGLDILDRSRLLVQRSLKVCALEKTEVPNAWYVWLTWVAWLSSGLQGEGGW